MQTFLICKFSVKTCLTGSLSKFNSSAIILIVRRRSLHIQESLLFQYSHQFSGSLEDKFREELASAGLAANQAMVKLESAQLTVLRQMAYTVGVDDAIAGNDAPTLQRRVSDSAHSSPARPHQ